MTVDVDIYFTLALAAATFVEWTRCVAPDRHRCFIDDVLDRYDQGSVFRFYQMEATLRSGLQG